MRRAFVLLGLVGVIVSTGTATPGAQGGPRGAAASAGSGNVEHGRYIVENVAMCFECHSGRDARGNLVESERYMGGLIPFSPPWPNEWAMRAPRNKGLPGYDDGLAMRLLTEGSIGRNGVQLRPPMVPIGGDRRRERASEPTAR